MEKLISIIKYSWKVFIVQICDRNWVYEALRYSNIYDILVFVTLYLSVEKIRKTSYSPGIYYKTLKGFH